MPQGPVSQRHRAFFSFGIEGIGNGLTAGWSTSPDLTVSGCSFVSPSLAQTRRLTIEVEVDMKTQVGTEFKTNVASRVAGEDLRRGDYVALLNETVRVPSYLWDGMGHSLASDKPVLLQFIPENSGEPFRVEAVCLPFVYVKTWCSKLVTIDTRCEEVVRIDRHCAKAVWKAKQKRQK